MNTTAIDFHEDGTISFIGDLPLDIDGTVIGKRRLSHIWPVHPVKRLAFRLVRWFVGDTGRVATWTRRWSGPWQVRLIEHGNIVAFTHSNRRECVRWEHAWFNGE